MSLNLGGGGTNAVSGAVNQRLLQLAQQKQNQKSELQGDWDKNQPPYGLQLTVFPKNHVGKATVEDPQCAGKFGFFSERLSQREKNILKTQMGMTAEALDDIFRPYLLPSGSKVSLFFINDETNRNRQARFYYQETSWDDKRGRYDDSETFLIPSPKSTALPEVIAAIHLLRKQLIDSYPNPCVAVSGVPSRYFRTFSEAYLRFAYWALGVPDCNIFSLTEEDGKNRTEESRQKLIERCGIVDVGGGEQEVFKTIMCRDYPSIPKYVAHRIKTDPDFHVVVTSAGMAIQGKYYIKDDGKGKRLYPLSVATKDIPEAGVIVGQGFGTIPNVFTETHLRGPKKNCDEDGNCQIGESGRDRFGRFLAALLSLTILFDVPKDQLPIGVASTEGTFAEIKNGKLRVISDDLGGCFVVDPKNIADFQFETQGEGDRRVVTLISATACPQGSKEPTELIGAKQSSDFNAFYGVGMVWHGEVLDLTTDPPTLVVARPDREHSFPLAEGCRWIDQDGHDVTAALGMHQDITR